MSISENHIYSGASQRPISGGKPMLVRRCVVLHYTEGATAQSSIDWWKKPQNREIDLGAHIIIERTGEVYQCRPFNKTISHAGKSRWVDPKTGKKYIGCNQFAIGIELANAGENASVIKVAEKLPGFAGTIAAKHRNGGKVKEWEEYPKAQFEACVELVKELVQRYNLDDITGHQEIAPERKLDPGPALNIKELREACGFGRTEPVVHWP